MEFRPGVPLRRQLEGALRVAIRSGRLAPGSVLPPSRDLADEIGVSRGVVVDSYAQLATEGYLTAKRGSGTHVALLPASGRPPAPRKVRVPEHFRYDLRPGQADFHAFPRARWKASLVRALRELPDRRLGYANHLGVAELRNAVAGYLARGRGVVVEPEHVVICCAASQALTVLWQALRQQGGRRVAVEDPGWRWQRYTVEHAGLEAVPVRVDADGLVVSELAAADVDAVVMTPAHQYPTGVVMTAERRSALITWARERRALIVEDDYDVEYRFGREPVASLQGLAPDLVAFVGTTSKTLAPALRLAWMVPPSHLIDDVENMLLVTGVTPPTLDQMAMASFIEDAALERHLRSMRRRYRAKRDVLVGALGTHLPGVRISGAAAGLHLLAWLPDGTDEHETAMRARRSGVGVHELHRHCTTHASSSPALILGFALPSESELRTATGLLAEAVA
ncbi:MAG: GntR family transcriptional regulator / MocR family aminotransferase [Streptosporangiaceae bacterium]|nr:GntR family transcriptional regulator / MocR family aminotransferase [Streptosporangiaceae bacterium]